MYNRNRGIRGILSPRLSTQEMAEDAAAREYVVRRVGPISEYKPLDPSIYRISATLDKLQAAPEQVKDKFGNTPAQKKKMIDDYFAKRPSPSEYKGSWNKFKKQQQEKSNIADAAPALLEAEPKIHTPAYRKKYPERYKKGYVPWYERNTEADDGVKKFNHHDSSTFPHAQKDKLMKAKITGELKDKIQTGKLPTKDGVKTLQYVTDTIKEYDDVPVSHKPRWMVNYQNGELEDVNHPDWMDNQIKQGLVPDGLAKQHQTDNKITQTKTKLGLIKTIPEKKSTVQQLEALRDFGQNRLIKEKN